MAPTRVIDRHALFVGMRTHCLVVGMIIEMNIRRRQAMLVLQVMVERDPVGFLRHVLADNPHPGHVLVGIERCGELPAPSARIEEGGHERQAQCQGFQLVPADKAA